MLFPIFDFSTDINLYLFGVLRNGKLYRVLDARLEQEFALIEIGNPFHDDLHQGLSVVQTLRHHDGGIFVIA